MATDTTTPVRYVLLLENGAQVTLTASPATEAGVSAAASRLITAGQAGYVAKEAPAPGGDLVLVRSFGSPDTLWAEARARAAQRARQGSGNTASRIARGR